MEQLPLPLTWVVGGLDLDADWALLICPQCGGARALRSADPELRCRACGTLLLETVAFL